MISNFPVRLLSAKLKNCLVNCCDPNISKSLLTKLQIKRCSCKHQTLERPTLSLKRYNSFVHTKELGSPVQLPCCQPLSHCRKPDPTNPSTDHFQYHTQGRKGLVTFGRFPCALLRLSQARPNQPQFVTHAR